jgi:TP901 family phage tail tape measure protein
MSKTLSLGIVISALGAGAAAAAIGSVTERALSIGKTIEKSNATIKNAGLETVDSFIAQKKAVTEASTTLDMHKAATTELGKSVAKARLVQESATNSLQEFRTELAGQTGTATEAQKLKLKLLREQLTGAEKDVSKLTREFDSARTKGRGMAEAVIMQTVKLERLRDELKKNGIATSDLAAHRRRIISLIDREQAAVDKLKRRYDELRTTQEKHAANRADMNSKLVNVAAAYGVGRMLGAPVGAFMRQDDALNSLQVAMMDKNGQVGESYKELKRQAVELGNILPGTTADFVGTARALMEQGVGIESVIGGGLKSAAQLSVVLRMPADEAGEMAAKLREAYKLSDQELTKMADSMQRAKFAFGMKPSDLMAASAYQAPMLNQLRISGIGNTNKMLAIQGMAAQVGLEGSSFGTNFSQMLARLAKGPAAIEMAKTGMKGQAKELMDSMGVTFEFFDKKGNFKGLDGMVKELEKLKGIKAKFGDQAAMEIADAMFGTEAARPAMILAEQGTAGYEAAQKRMADQADLQQRIQKTVESSRNTWDALTGSVENFAAAAAGPAVKALHPLGKVLNDAAGALTDFTEKHPTAAKWLGLTVAGLGAATIAFLAVGVGMSFFSFALTGARLIPGVLTLGRGVGFLGGILRGGLFTGLRMAGQAVLFLGRALLMNPIGLAITAIALGAYLIYKNWDWLSAKFGKIWSAVKQDFSIAWTWFKSLPTQFTTLGSDLIDGLVGGVTARLGKAKNAIVGFGQNVKGWFAETLGIKSPSRVFVGFGHNIGEGAQIGILKGVPGVRSAVGKLAGVALAGAVTANGSAFAGVKQAADMLQSSRASASSAAGQSGDIKINFAPVINVTSGGADAGRQVDAALKVSMRELEQLVRRLQAEQERRRF